VTVGDLSTTDLTTVDIDLGVAGVGDAAADQVVVEGTGGGDIVQATTVGASPQVNGLASQVLVTNSEAANDRLTVRGLSGGDTLSGGALASLMQLTLDGGDGNDTLNGGNGADTLIGGEGADGVDGNGGNDVAFLGAGNDTYTWDPGDGSDIIEGQDGGDTLHFNGSAGSEIFAASSNGGRLLFTRNVGNIVMDADDVETLDLNTLGGADTATVNDLAATDIAFVNIDLGVNGLGDGAADALTVNGTVGVDVMNLSGSAGSVSVLTPGVALNVLRAEPANDTLTVNVSSGADLVSASGLAASSLFHLTLNGGNDNDILVGSSGADTLNGDAGAGDYCDGGPGIDAGATCETSVNIP
jgi:Ca2+-binding RTX toxin-like protein